MSLSFTNCLKFSWIRKLTIQNYTTTTHTNVSNPFPGWVFVSLIKWHILINRTVFLRKRKSVSDNQSFNVGACIIWLHSCNVLQNGRTYFKFISADDVSNEITVGLQNRRKIYASWDGQYLVNLWLGCPFKRHMSVVESPFFLFFHIITIIWVFFSWCIAPIHNFWCLIGEFENQWFVKRFPVY